MLDSAGITTTLLMDENENAILDFPTELLEFLGWEEGDTLDIQAFAGRIVISKVANRGNEGGDSPNL